MVSQSESIKSIINLGVEQYNSGDFPTAIETYQSGLVLEENNPLLHYNLGLVFQKIGRSKQAISAYQKSLELKADNAQAYNNIGVIWVQEGKFDLALSAFRQAVLIDNNYIEVYSSIGQVLEKTARIEQAIIIYKRALDINIGHAPTHNHLGLAYHKTGQFDLAIDSFRQAIIIWPEYAGAYSNLGVSLKEQENLEEALECYEKALQLEPNQPEANSNKGKLLLEIGETDSALYFYDKATHFAPNDHTIRSNMLFASLHSSEITPQTLAERHQKWGKTYPPSSTEDRTRLMNRDTLNIGYVSPDFRQHAWASFIDPILANHNLDNRNNFDVFCYSQVNDKDNITSRFKSMADHWRDISHLSDQQAADMIVEDKIDILVDLSGHTADNRLRMFNLKPAPIQAILGHYQSTTGLKTMDYRLTDCWVDPPDTANLYDEKLIYLDYGTLCYDPPNLAPPVQPPPSEQNGYITFCSFNRLTKVNCQVIALWAQVLKAVPDSILMMKDRWFSQKFVRNKFYDSFLSHGIEPNRLNLISTVESYQDHLNLYNQADIALDPFPCNGQTTSCEGLWMGLPVLTWSGNRCSQRFGNSLLSRLELRELIATDKSEYVVKAINVANNREMRKFLRADLRQQMRQKICDGSTFVQQLENSYRKMVSIHLQSN
ncbi:hypothetical protein CMK15_00120 [Candidatus Poribacteria bacterium]|nr:hypothetical protein [Candidatus Poribacteria bacterium]